MAETLPAKKRTHEMVPPDDPAELLAYYEAVIDESVRVADDEQRRAWLALEEIHRLELWRQTHRSFTAYLDERFSMSRVTAYRQIGWARAVNELPGGVPKVVTRVTTPSQRSTSRPPRGKAEAVEVGSDDTRTSEAQPGPLNGRGSSPRADGATSPRGAQPPTPPPHEQLALFSVTKLLEEAFNNRKAEVLGIDESKRRQLAKRMRTWADLLDPPKTQPKASPAVETKPSDCRHPVGSRIGDQCAICFATVKGKR